jgi:PKD repeat protein
MSGYTWNFGDGSSASGETVTHVFVSPGTYAINLDAVGFMITTAYSCSQQASFSVLVFQKKPPIAFFTIVPNPAKTGYTVIFDASSSYDPDGKIVRYRWDFDDGSSYGTDQYRVTHQYSQPGSYQVTLRVLDNDELENSVQQSLAVNAPVAPQARFTISRTPVKVEKAVEFDASGSYDQDGTITSYRWDFGDGTPSGYQSRVSHRYGAAGTYRVILRVLDNDGLAGDAEQLVPVVPLVGPIAKFTMRPSPLKAGETVTLDASASYDPDGNIVAYSWDFGDGSRRGTTSAPTHRYPDPGTFRITLVVTDNEGLTNSSGHDLVVSEKHAPIADFRWDPASTKPGKGVIFDASLSRDTDGIIASYRWDFGDGTGGQGARTTHTYDTPGTYTVRLVVSDDDGLSGDRTHGLEVAGEIPVVPLVLGLGLAVGSGGFYYWRNYRRCRTKFLPQCEVKGGIEPQSGPGGEGCSGCPVEVECYGGIEESAE